MVEISKFDYGFKVTTSSTEMAEIAEIDPLQLTEQGAAGDAATTITIMAGAVLAQSMGRVLRDQTCILPASCCLRCTDCRSTSVASVIEACPRGGDFWLSTLL